MLTSLPRTRPVRRSAKRGDRADVKTGTASPQSRHAAATKPKAAKSTAKAKATTTARATTAKAKPATSTAAKPKAAAPPSAAPRRKVPPAGYAAPTSRGDEGGGAGTADMLSTTIQAAAELAQIGLTVGRQTLRSMIDRLPKP